MRHRDQGNIGIPALGEDGAMPAAKTLHRMLAKLTGGLLPLLHVLTLALVQGGAWCDEQHASRHALTRGATPIASAPPVPLQRRGMGWTWHLLCWAIATVTAPTFLLFSSLLLINSHSDHPFFWWSLPAIVGIGNAAAILRVNQIHHHQPYTDPSPLAWRHAGVSMATGATLFLLTGWISGFLPDVAPSLANAASTSAPALTTALWIAVLTTAFGVLSFAHAGIVHACIGFHSPDARYERPPARMGTSGTNPSDEPVPDRAWNAGGWR